MQDAGMNTGAMLGRLVAATIAIAFVSSVPALAQTLEQALGQAYRNNETLNAERASLRGIDEEVPQALSGFRPRVEATTYLGRRYLNEQGADGERETSTTTPRGVGLTAAQTIFNGSQTSNRVRMAENQVLAGREVLRVMEQTVLLDAVTAYMDVLRNAAVLELQRRNLDSLHEQLEVTRNRQIAGQLTFADVAEVRSRFASARSEVLAAEAANDASRATFERVIGSQPGKLTPGQPADRFVPSTLDAAIDVGRTEHPAVTAAMYGADVALLQTKIAEGALYPTVTLEGNVRRRWDATPEQFLPFPGTSTDASIVGRVVVPLYQGGSEYAKIRQSKEAIGQKRLSLEAVRKLARATVVQAWGLTNAAKAQIESVQSQVQAAEIAYDAVRSEFGAGQRSTFELLTLQQELLNSRVALVNAQRARVVTSYTLLSAVGRLSPQVLGLPTKLYDPSVHYDQVRDSWFGIRTPDGR
jgi:outer membrane protein